MRQGKFIVLEGTDGSGKTTQAKILSDRLTSEGVDNVIVRDPGQCKTAEDIREIILKHDSLDNATELLLFLAARKELIEKEILPAMREGKTVICDRFLASTMVYQILTKYSPKSLAQAKLEVLKALDFHAGTSLTADLTLFLIADPELSIKRSKQGEVNRFDVADLKAVSERRDAYIWIASRDHAKSFTNSSNVIWIDDESQTVDDIAEIIYEEAAIIL